MGLEWSLDHILRSFPRFRVQNQRAQTVVKLEEGGFTLLRKPGEFAGRFHKARPCSPRPHVRVDSSSKQCPGSKRSKPGASNSQGKDGGGIEEVVLAIEEVEGQRGGANPQVNAEENQDTNRGCL
jgi:hypothetical protein